MAGPMYFSGRMISCYLFLAGNKTAQFFRGLQRDLSTGRVMEAIPIFSTPFYFQVDLGAIQVLNLR